MPNTDSQSAYDTLKREFPQRHGDEAQIVFADVTKDRPAIDAYLAKVAKVKGVEDVQPIEVSPGGLVAIAPITTAAGSGTHPKTTAADIKDLAAPLRKEGVPVEFAGNWFSEGGMPASEIIGVVAAIIVLLIAFGSVIAMGLPILTAIIGIVISLAGVGILANFLTTPDFAPQVAAMIGIGVGIDYALFIVTRYREALHRTNSPEAAVLEAMTTSGRAVVFAGFTVMVSLLGMLLMGLNFLHGLAVGTSLAVVIAVAAAITLLPAMLGFVGFTIDRLKVGRRKPSTRRGDVAPLGAHRAAAPGPDRDRRLHRAHPRRPPDALPAPRERRREQRREEHHDAQGLRPDRDRLRPGRERPDPGRGRHLEERVGRGGAEADRRRSARPRGSLRSPTRGRIPPARPRSRRLIAKTGPQSETTERLVHHLRDDVVPSATAGTALVVNLGGQTASAIDFSDVIGSRLPIFIGAVLLLSFLLLMLVFRSVLVPLKAVLMNLLSIAAAYGVIVATFQWGWGGSILGVSAGPDRGLGADDALRHRLRSLDGLRGLPHQRHPRALRPQW